MELRFAVESDLPGLMALINQAFQVERFFLIGSILKRAVFCLRKTPASWVASTWSYGATARISGFFLSTRSVKITVSAGS
jgi:hypothetical protein